MSTTDNIITLAALYVIAAAVILYVGIYRYSVGRRRSGARLILGALVFPVALLLAGVRGLMYWIPVLWRDAWGDEDA